jgi:hypothetical protein
MNIVFGPKIGDLTLQDWDEAIARGLGAQYDQEKNQWFLQLDWEIIPDDGVHTAIDKALVIFKKSEPTNVNMALPEITIIRDNVVPATNRELTPVVQYRLPAPGAVRISAGGQLGWSAYETKDKAEPYDISYTIECWARYRVVAQQLLQIVMAKFPIRGKVVVTDSENNNGTYAVYQMGSAELTQISSMVDRVAGFSLSIKCEGELTLDKASFTVSAFTGGTSSSPIPGITNIGTGTIDGSPSGTDSLGNPADPNPGPGGLYGTGKPIIRTGLVEDV